MWRALTDERLVETLLLYAWLAAHTPHTHATRIDARVRERRRRGRGDVAERILARVSQD